MSKKKVTKAKAKPAPKAKKPVAKKAVKPVKKAVKPASKPKPKPKAKPAPKAAKKVVSKKVAKPVKKTAKPAPAAKKVAPQKEVAKKAAAPVKAVVKPVVKAVAKPAVKPTVAPAVKPSKAILAKKNVESRPVRPAEKNPVLPPMPPPVKPAISKSPLAPTAKLIQEDPNKTRYSDKELEEFRIIIETKLEDSRRELTLLQAQMTAANDHGTDDTANTFKMLEDGSESLAKEEAGQLAGRQKKFIEQLENALVRIENKTYGICRVTGKLIPKERLRAVPHTTQSIEAKINQYRD